MKPIENEETLDGGASIDEKMDALQFPKTIYAEWWRLYDRVLADLKGLGVEPVSKWEIPTLVTRDDALTGSDGYSKLVLVTGGVNPLNGLFADPVIVDKLLESAGGGKSVSIIFGVPVIVHDNTKRSYFFDKLLDMLDKQGNDDLLKHLELRWVEKPRPQLHFLATNDTRISVEYPHHEWDAVRRRVRAEARSPGDFAALTQFLFDFYKARSRRLTTRREVADLYAANRTTIADARADHLDQRRRDLSCPGGTCE